jgi:hypothetical protein
LKNLAADVLVGLAVVWAVVVVFSFSAVIVGVWVAIAARAYLVVVR